MAQKLRQEKKRLARVLGGHWIVESFRVSVGRLGNRSLAERGGAYRTSESGPASTSLTRAGPTSTERACEFVAHTLVITNIWPGPSREVILDSKRSEIPRGCMEEAHHWSANLPKHSMICPGTQTFIAVPQPCANSDKLWEISTRQPVRFCPDDDLYLRAWQL
nr:hypothetical protein CFP56_56550 [Quercus suber]